MTATTPVIAVTTPTGRVGSHVVRLLAQAGVRPRVLVRDPDKLGDAANLVDAVVGDLTDPGAVARLLDGADSAYLVLPEDFTAADPLADVRACADVLVAGVRAAGVPRVVLQSSVGAEVREGAGLIDGLAHAEVLLDAYAEETGASVLHLRCGFFMSNLAAGAEAIAAGTLEVTGDPGVATPFVAPADIATVAALNLLTGWSGRRVQAVHGPAHLTWTEAAEALASVLGRPVEVVVRTDDERLAQLTGVGMGDTAAGQVVAMSTGLAGFTPEQPRSPLTTTPTTLAGWAQQVLRPTLED